jgi:hypothetical protein
LKSSLQKCYGRHHDLVHQQEQKDYRRTDKPRTKGLSKNKRTIEEQTNKNKKTIEEQTNQEQKDYRRTYKQEQKDYRRTDKP